MLFPCKCDVHKGFNFILATCYINSNVGKAESALASHRFYLVTKQHYYLTFGDKVQTCMVGSATDCTLYSHC